MLVLTRKPNQTIKIGDTVKIKIIEIGNGFVKIGIEAPKEIQIYREELFDKLTQMNLEAARLDVEAVKGLLKIEKEDS
jgi:carbon storage regulator